MAARIISFATQKGGVGKSTLLMLTASAIHNRTDKNVLVIDSDPQKSIKEFQKSEKKTMNREVINPYDIYSFDWNQRKPEVNFQKIIALSEKKYDVILIDVPGRIEGKEVYHSILVSDIIIVPIVASILDINSTFSFLYFLPEILKEKEKRGFSLEVYGVINKRDKSREHKVMKQLNGVGGMKFFYSRLSNFVRYKRDLSTYKDITDPYNKDDEFNKYFDEFTVKCLT